MDRSSTHSAVIERTPPRLEFNSLSSEGRSEPRGKKLSAIEHNKYPSYLSRAVPSDILPSQSVKPNLANEPSRLWNNTRRNFLSDTWQPPHSNSIEPSVRRIVSAPSSQATSSSSFRTLKREDPKFLASRQRYPSGSQTEYLGTSTPTLTADSGSFATVSEHALDDFEEADTTVTTADLVPESLRLDTHPLLLAPKARHQLVPSFQRDVNENHDSGNSSDEDASCAVPPRGPKSSRSGVSGAGHSRVSVDLDKPPSLRLPQAQPSSANCLRRTASSIVPLASERRNAVATGTPSPLNTAYLSPQTQKLLKGQVIILPSKSLLVDLREGERRQGGRGTEVLVISADGQIVGRRSVQ